MVFVFILLTIVQKQIFFTQKSFYDNISYYMNAQKGVVLIITGKMNCLTVRIAKSIIYINPCFYISQTKRIVYQMRYVFQTSSIPHHKSFKRGQSIGNGEILL